MVMFLESALHCHVDKREVEADNKFVDIWAKGFNIVSKGEPLTQWFENRSQLQPARDSDVTDDYDEMTLSELEEEMELTDEREYIINLDGHMWEFDNDGVPSPSMSGVC